MGNVSDEPVPYSLTYRTSTKRFTRETNQDNSTSLIFGNGVLQDGQLVDEGYIDKEQIGLIIPGQTNNLNTAIDPLLGNEYSTLGETPNQTTLTITYRVGGGVSSNVPSGNITTTPTLNAQNGNTDAELTSVINNQPAHGGKDEEDIIEIKEKARAFFSTQNRCVTKEDYEARVMNVPSKFGSLAKVYVTRGDVNNTLPILNSDYYNDLLGLLNNISPSLSELGNNIQSAITNTPGVNIATYDDFQTIVNMLLPSGTIMTELGVYGQTLQDQLDAFVINPTGTTELQLLEQTISIVVNILKGEPLGGLVEENLPNPLTGELNTIQSLLNNLSITAAVNSSGVSLVLPNLTQQLNALQLEQSDVSSLPTIVSSIPESLNNFVNSVQQENFSELSTINIYALGYNNRKQLVGNKHFSSLSLPNTLTNNIKNYLQNFKLMTDTITINDGYVVNFGVVFDIIAEKYANKQQVKLRCIQIIKDYFKIEKMQFNQPIFLSNLEFELMGVEGVRSIGHVTITQKDDYNSDSGDADLLNSTYTYNFSTDAEALIDRDGDGNDDGSFVDASLLENGGLGTSGYGYKYNFENALSSDGTIILPPNVATPTVFELKNPNQNIQGRVR